MPTGRSPPDWPVAGAIGSPDFGAAGPAEQDALAAMQGPRGAELKRGIFPAATLKQAHDEDEDDDDDDEMGDHSRGFIGLRAKKPTSR
jgi:hypothetical protein